MATITVKLTEAEAEALLEAADDHAIWLGDNNLGRKLATLRRATDKIMHAQVASNN